MAQRLLLRPWACSPVQEVSGKPCKVQSPGKLAREVLSTAMWIALSASARLLQLPLLQRSYRAFRWWLALLVLTRTERSLRQQRCSKEALIFALLTSDSGGASISASRADKSALTASIGVFILHYDHFSFGLCYGLLLITCERANAGDQDEIQRNVPVSRSNLLA